MKDFKVYINDVPVYFIERSLDIEFDVRSRMSIEYSDPSDFELIHDLIESGSDLNEVSIMSDDSEGTWKSFCNFHKIIEAAGGVVVSEDNNLLFIFRLNRWDLPKGKIDKGETIEKAAIREVEEECGIRGPKILKPLPDSFHTYTLKGKRILKRTYWFLMSYNGDDDLFPQIEENITEVRWLSQSEFEELKNLAYPSIRELTDYTFDLLSIA